MAREAADPRKALSLRRVRPAYEQVAEQLRNQILDGTLNAGDRLPPETELVTLLGVSRSTLREALSALAARDLVHTVRGVSGGTFVSRVDPAKISSYLETSLGLLSGEDALSVEEILEARETLEVPAARLAAERATADQVETLRLASRRATARTIENLRFQEHKTFHTVVVEASGNRLLALMNEPNFRVLATRFRRSDVSEAWWREVDADHVEIADLVADGRGEEAAAAMMRHLERLRDLYRPLDR